MNQVPKGNWKNSIKNLLLSPLRKHPIILHLYEENTTIPDYSQKFLQTKIEIQHRHIHTHTPKSKEEIIKPKSNTT